MAAEIPFVRDLTFDYGKVDQVTPLIRRVIAENPGPFTFHGTGTYIVGHGNVAVIDPGPLVDNHVDALLAAVTDETVTHILITHTHRDHSPAAEPFKRATGAPVFAQGPHSLGTTWSDVDRTASLGADLDFQPDHVVHDGDIIAGDGWTFEVVHTPGHTNNHLCFALQEESALFSGDQVMGWSTTVVSPPDGDMRDYIQSCRKLLDRDDATYWPTHGPCITDPKKYVAALIEHREQREVAITAALQAGTNTIAEIVADMYKDVAINLHAAAARVVHAHLVHMMQTGRATCDGPPTDDATYEALDE